MNYDLTENVGIILYNSVFTVWNLNNLGCLVFTALNRFA